MKRSSLRTLAGLTVLASLYSAAHAAPQIVGKAPSGIPIRTLHLIDALERDADARTPAQLKIDSQLLYTLKMARGEAIVPGIQTLRTGVKADSTGRTTVDMNATVSTDLFYAITRAGGTVLSSSERFGTLRATVPLSSLETLASLPTVRWIKPAVVGQLQNPAPLQRSARLDLLAPFVLPMPERVSLSQKAANLRVHLSSLLARVNAGTPGPATSGIGSFTDEGDKTHQADKARSTYGIDGTGIKVGVLSDSIDNGNGIYQDAVNSGDVSPVTVISGQSGGDGSGEGLAMLEVVHHLAPGAQLYFATGNAPNLGEGGMADNIIALQKAGCKVIIDDIGYPDESPFQDAVISQAVNTVTAAGAMYFSSAANNGNLADGTASVWEDDYKDSGDTSFGDGDIHTFNSSDGGPGETDEIEVDTQSGESPVELFWSDPLGKSSNDYDLLILNQDFDIVASSTNRQTGSQDPYEEADAVTGDYAVIVKHSGSTRFLHLDLAAQHAIFNYVTNDRTRGHNAAANTFCCAATPAADAQQDGDPSGPYPDPFNSSNVVETFSNDGPRHVFYDANGKAFTSSLTSSGGKILDKPDFTAADGTTTSLTQDEVGSGKESLSPFFGTSCAAPHAGAIAALVLSYNPTLTRAQLATILDGSATDIMAKGFDIDAGNGILNALKALQNTPSGNTVKPKSISFTPNPVVGGQGTKGTITLTADAPSGGAAVTITENGTSIGTVTVPAGDTSVTFTLTPPTVTATETDTIGAVYNGTTVTTSLTVNPAASAVTLSSLVLTPTSVTGGTSDSGKVTLSSTAPTGGATVTLKSSNTAVATVPSSETIAAGDKTYTFVITTKAVTSSQTVTITATIGSSTKTATLTVTPGTTSTLSSLVLTPTSVAAGQTSSGKVTLSATAPTGGATVTLKSSNTAVATVPASETIAAGDKTYTFVITTKAVTSTQTVTITATIGSSTKTATLTVTPVVSSTLSSLVLTPTSVTAGTTSSGKVTLSSVAPSGGVTITLKSSDTSSATVPSTISIAAGDKTQTFTITTKGVTSTKTVTITAAIGSSTKTATLTITPASTKVTPTSLSFNPNEISSDGETTGTVTLSGAAPSGGAVVTITENGTSLGTITVPAGSTSTTFLLSFDVVSATAIYTYDATYNGGSASGSVTVRTTSVTVTKLSFSPSTITSGGSTTGTVTLSSTAPKGGADVEIYQGSTDLGYVTVPAGQSSYQFTYTPSTVTSTTKYTMKASYNSSSVTTSLTVDKA